MRYCLFGFSWRREAITCRKSSSKHPALAIGSTPASSVVQRRDCARKLPCQFSQSRNSQLIVVGHRPKLSSGLRRPTDIFKYLFPVYQDINYEVFLD